MTGESLTGPLVIVMGVSGAGKSTVGAAVASTLATAFLDGDELHPPENVAKMAAGTPLDDDDRRPWLAAVGRALAAAGPGGLVIACSALKRSYRDAIRHEAPSTVFVELDGTPELLRARLEGRAGHFMPVRLLDSQLASLEPLGDDERGVRIDVASPPAWITARASSWISLQGPP